MNIDDLTPILDLDQVLDDAEGSNHEDGLEWSATLRRTRDLDDLLAPPPGLKLQGWASLMEGASPQPVTSAVRFPATERRARRSKRSLLAAALAAAPAVAALWLVIVVSLPRSAAVDPFGRAGSYEPAVESNLAVPPSRSRGASSTAWAAGHGTVPSLIGLSLTAFTPSGLVGLAALGLDDAFVEVSGYRDEWRADLAAHQDALLRASGLLRLAASPLPTWFSSA